MTHRGSAYLQILGRTLAQWRAMSRNVGHRSFVTAHHHWSLVTLGHRVLACLGWVETYSHFTVIYCTYCSAPDTCHLSRKSGSNLLHPVTSGACKVKKNSKNYRSDANQKPSFLQSVQLLHTNTPTHQHTNTPTHQHTNTPTHQHTNTLTH